MAATRAQQLLQDFTTPEGLDVAACAAAALRHPPSPEQVAELERADEDEDEAAQLALLEAWLDTAPPEFDDADGGDDAVCVVRLGGVVNLVEVRTKQDILKKLSREHGVSGRLVYEDGAAVGDGELGCRKLLLLDEPLIMKATELEAPSAWDNAVTDIVQLRMTAEHAQILRRAFPRLCKIAAVAAPDCGNETNGVIAFAGSFELVPQLQVLDMYFQGSEIGDAGFVAIGECLPHLQRLQRIQMNFLRCDVMWTDFVEINKGLQTLQQLQELEIDLSYTEARNSDVVGISKCLQNLRKLQKIEMRFDGCKGIGDAGAVGLGNCCQNLEQLTHVDLSFYRTSLGNAGALAILNGLQDSERLRRASVTLFDHTPASILEFVPIIDQLEEREGADVHVS
mmetsp:Transcript_5106/g.12544  ORF Transcript_5106/g.12544 Transcript_5106/m.12544 type:complete len:396 (-) Transcript_5106:117-1304(-)